LERPKSFVTTNELERPKSFVTTNELERPKYFVTTNELERPKSFVTIHESVESQNLEVEELQGITQPFFRFTPFILSNPMW
jgi:hypothetical protein